MKEVLSPEECMHLARKMKHTLSRPKGRYLSSFDHQNRHVEEKVEEGGV
jgi:hypothetical protein